MGQAGWGTRARLAAPGGMAEAAVPTQSIAWCLGRLLDGDAEDLLFLLLEILALGGLGRGSLNRLGLVGAGAGIDVTLFVIDVGVFTQPGQIGAQRGLQLLVIQSILELRLDIFHRRNACLLVAG